MKKSLRSLVLSLVLITPILFVYQSCAGSSSSDGAPGAGTANAAGLTEKIVMLRDGYNGYTGTRDTTIYLDATDWNQLRLADPAPTADIMAAIMNLTLSNSDRAFALISFDVANVANDLLRNSETCADHIEVARAELTVYGNIGPSAAYVSAAPLLESAPAWTESGATYTSANGTDAWPTGSPNPAQPVLNVVDGTVHDTVLSTTFNNITHHFTFHINTESVKNWICDSSKNRGVLLRHGAMGGMGRFFTREHANRSYRPSLTLWMRRI